MNEGVKLNVTREREPRPYILIQGNINNQLNIGMFLNICSWVSYTLDMRESSTLYTLLCHPDFS